MPSLATTNRFQQIDQKSLQTFMALSDLGLGHVTDYHGLKRVSILNVVILKLCPVRASDGGYQETAGDDPTHPASRSRRPAAEQQVGFTKRAVGSATHYQGRLGEHCG